MLGDAEKWLAKIVLEPGENSTLAADHSRLRSLLRERILEEGRRLVTLSGQKYPPFDPQRLFALRHIRDEIIWDTGLHAREAVLVPIAGGFVVKMNPDTSAFRKRSSMSHEIGHTFFYDLSSEIPRKRYLVQPSKYWVEEDYAYQIGREILVPEPFLSDTVHALGGRPSVLVLRTLRNRFAVSYEILLRRLLYDAHGSNRKYWSDPWEAIAITATESKKAGDPEVKLYRSPKYRQRLRGLLKKDIIHRMIQSVLGDGISTEKTFSAELGDYVIDAAIGRKEPPMALLLIFRGGTSPYYG